MEEGDSELIDKVIAKGDGFTLKVMDATLWLEMEVLRKRLACGVALKLMGFTVEELKEEYDIGDASF